MEGRERNAPHEDHGQRLEERTLIFLFTSFLAPTAKIILNFQQPGPQKPIKTANLRQFLYKSHWSVQVSEQKPITSSDLWLIMYGYERHKKQFHST